MDIKIIYKDIAVCEVNKEDLDTLNFKALMDEIDSKYDTLSEEFKVKSREILNQGGLDIKFEDMVLLDLDGGTMSIITRDDLDKVFSVGGEDESETR